MLFSSTLPNAKRHHLICYDASTSKERWRQTTPFAITWIDVHDHTLLASGPRGIANLDVRNGTLQWTYLTSRRFHSPTWANSQKPKQIYVLEEKHRLFALDVESGIANWTRWCPGAFLEPPHTPIGFTHVHAVGSETIHLELADQRHWILNASDGETLNEWNDTSAKTVTHRDPLTGKIRWQIPLDHPSTLGAEPGRAICEPPHQWLIVERNYGITLQRLEEGKRTWKRPLIFPSGQIHDFNLTQDATTLYVVMDHVLSAHRLTDGLRLWKKELEGANQEWTVLKQDKALIAFPVRARHRHFPLSTKLGTLRATLTLPLEADFGHGFPLLVIDPESGKLIQRLSFSGGRPQWKWDFRKSFSPQRGPVPQVCPTQNGMLVTLNEQAWLIQSITEQN